MAATNTATKRKTSASTGTKRGRPKKKSIKAAWKERGELGLCEALIDKYADIIDSTNSGRDMKPLATGLLETIDRYKSLKAAQGESSEEELKPVFRILKAANEQ